MSANPRYFPVLFSPSFCLSICKASVLLAAWDSGNTDLILGPQGCLLSSLQQPALSSWLEALPIIPEPLMGKAELTAPWGG